MWNLFRVFIVCGSLFAQSIFEIRVEKITFYAEDTFDYARLATEASPVSPTAARNFDRFLGVGDITAINGEPAKGVWVGRVQTFNISPTPQPGQAIGDIAMGQLLEWHFQILTPDGTQVGGIYAKGIPTFGPSAPGTPPAARSSLAIIGGNGAYLGARGQVGFAAAPELNPPVSGGNASMREDPSRRREQPRQNTRSFIVHMLPDEQPMIQSVLHSDFSPVTTANPARKGEVLIAMATGLGPTRSALAPGMPYPLPPEQPMEVSSPVEVNIAGHVQSALNKVGWPGMVNTYRVDFRVPDSTPSGQAAVELTVAWISGRQHTFFAQ